MCPKVASKTAMEMKLPNRNLSLYIYIYQHNEKTICKNKGADQLCGNCTADQHLCFRYTDRTAEIGTNLLETMMNIRYGEINRGYSSFWSEYEFYFIE